MQEKESLGSCLGADDILSHMQEPSSGSTPLNPRLQSDHFKAAIKNPLCSLPWQHSPSASAAVTAAARPAANQTIRSHFMKSSRSVRSSPGHSRPQGEVPLSPARSSFTLVLATDKSRNFSPVSCYYCYLLLLSHRGTYTCVHLQGCQVKMRLMWDLPDQTYRMSCSAEKNI